MKMTKACEYGLQGVLYLAMQPIDKAALLSEIAEARHIPNSFLGKIFRLLSKVGIVKSIRGVKGGFILGRPSDTITMKDVVEAVEGPIAFSDCSNNTSCERMHYCSMSNKWKQAQQQALGVLEKVTFKELADQEIKNRQQ